MPPSCRVAQALTETVRREWAQQSRAELRRITWHVPGLVWSLDDAELARLAGRQQPVWATDSEILGSSPPYNSLVCPAKTTPDWKQLTFLRPGGTTPEIFD
ncbi:MAG: hypothetical protein ABSB82_16060 [Terriglobia bacterium]|jgi:hypothetical protein